MNAHTNKGRFGKFGGRYVPETLVPALDELEYNYKKMRNDARFKKELAGYLRTFAGRPTPCIMRGHLLNMQAGRGYT